MDGGQTRVQYIKPLLDAIVDQSYKWNPDQCARFFEELLRKYVEEEHREFLLAVCGFGVDYEDTRAIKERREKFEKHSKKYKNYEDTTPRKLETHQLEKIANILELDHKNNESRLAKQLLVSVLSDQELKRLRIYGIDLPRESDSNNDVLLRQTERISNIDPTNWNLKPIKS